VGLSSCPIFVAFSSYLFGLLRLFRDLQPDIQIASISQQFTHHESWKEENLTLQSTSLRYMFLNSKMPFGSGFVFSRINTTELIFYQLLLSLGRSLKLIWIVFVIRNFSFTLQRLWCTVFQLDSNTFIYFSQNRTFSGHPRLFSASRLLQPISFLFVFSLTKWERPDVCQEKITCLCVQLFFCSRTDLFFLYVCHNHAS